MSTKTITVPFVESTSRNRSQTVTIPKLKNIVSVSVNTGNVSHTINGETVTINVSNGTYTRYTTSSYVDTIDVNTYRVSYPGISLNYIWMGSTHGWAEGSTGGVPRTASYNSNGYTGVLNYSSEYMNAGTSSGPPSYPGKTLYEVVTGYTCTKTGVYDGKASKNITNYTYYYAYTVTITYLANDLPSVDLMTGNNLLGTDGNCENLQGWSVYSTDILTLSQAVKKYGMHSFKFSNVGNNGHRYKDNLPLDATKYYLASVDVFIESFTSGSYRLFIADAGGFTNSISANANVTKIGVWQNIYLKFTGKANTRLSLGNGSNTTGVTYMDGVRLYEISREVYNKIDIDPEYSGDKLVAKFPYTDPTIPSALPENTPLLIQGTATDPDPGNVLTVKYKINNGTPQALQSGVSDGSTPLSFAKTLTFRNKRLRDGTTDVTGADLAENVDHTLTVWAEDDQGGKSTEVVRKFRVIHNRAPIISDQDRSLGTIKSSPSITYTVADPEENPFTITEKINGSTIRSYSGVPNRQETLTIPANKWLMLEPGVSHTLTITAADEQGKSSSRTFTFTRQVNEILFEGLQVPMETDIAAERILLTPDWQIPLGAEVRVEVCNNGFDAEPTWEDCTIPAKMGRGYAFLNTVKTAEKWGVNFRVRIQKGTATSEASLSGIGGAYDVHPSL